MVLATRHKSKTLNMYEINTFNDFLSLLFIGFSVFVITILMFQSFLSVFDFTDDGGIRIDFRQK